MARALEQGAPAAVRMKPSRTENEIVALREGDGSVSIPLLRRTFILGDMPKVHPDAAGKKLVYRIKSPEVWKAIRAEWEAGGRPAALSRRFDVSDSSISARIAREGWSREQGIERFRTVKASDITPVQIAEKALERAMEALSQGRAQDAQALIRAGDAVGAFADFVRRLRAGEGAGAGAASAPGGPGSGSGAEAAPAPSAEA